MEAFDLTMLLHIALTSTSSSFVAINKVYTCKVQISSKISPRTKTRVTADVIECRVRVRAYS